MKCCTVFTNITFLISNKTVPRNVVNPIQQSSNPDSHAPPRCAGAAGPPSEGPGGPRRAQHMEKPPLCRLPQAPPPMLVNVSTQINQIHMICCVQIEKKARAGVDISGDSVSVITSVLIIRIIDPSCSQNLRLKKNGLSWGRYFG